MTSIHEDAMAAALEAIKEALRDDRVGMAIKMTMVGPSCVAFQEAIAKAIVASVEKQDEIIRSLSESCNEAADNTFALLRIVKERE